MDSTTQDTNESDDQFVPGIPARYCTLASFHLCFRLPMMQQMIVELDVKYQCRAFSPLLDNRA
eukprot:5444364-Pleurochrysis_carterae.AAC.1